MALTLESLEEYNDALRIVDIQNLFQQLEAELPWPPHGEDPYDTLLRWFRVQEDWIPGDVVSIQVKWTARLTKLALALQEHPERDGWAEYAQVYRDLTAYLHKLSTASNFMWYTRDQRNTQLIDYDTGACASMITPICAEMKGTTFQKAVVRLIEAIQRNRYRKLGDTCYEEQQVPGVANSHSWKPALTIKEFVHREANSLVDPELYNLLTQPWDNMDKAAKHLEQHTFPQFKQVVFDRRWRGFLNGLYDIYNDCFWSFEYRSEWNGPVPRFVEAHRNRTCPGYYVFSAPTSDTTVSKFFHQNFYPYGNRGGRTWQKIADPAEADSVNAAIDEGACKVHYISDEDVSRSYTVVDLHLPQSLSSKMLETSDQFTLPSNEKVIDGVGSGSEPGERRYFDVYNYIGKDTWRSWRPASKGVAGREVSSAGGSAGQGRRDHGCRGQGGRGQGSSASQGSCSAGQGGRGQGSSASQGSSSAGQGGGAGSSSGESDGHDVSHDTDDDDGHDVGYDNDDDDDEESDADDADENGDLKGFVASASEEEEEEEEEEDEDQEEGGDLQELESGSIGSIDSKRKRGSTAHGLLRKRRCIADSDDESEGAEDRGVDDRVQGREDAGGDPGAYPSDAGAQDASGAAEEGCQSSGEGDPGNITCVLRPGDIRFDECMDLKPSDVSIRSTKTYCRIALRDIYTENGEIYEDWETKLIVSWNGTLYRPVKDSARVQSRLEEERFQAHELHAPAFEHVLKYQKYTDSECQVVFAMLGRTLFPVNLRERWNKQFFLIGKSQTGKSTTLNQVKHLFNITKVGTISNIVQEQFSLSGLEGQHIGLAFEIKKDFNFPQAIWQSCVSGESVVVNEKFKLPRTVDAWDVPFLMAGNEFMGYTNKSQCVNNRLFIVEFNRVIEEGRGDTSIPDRMVRETAVFVKKLVFCYHDLVKKIGSGRVDDSEHVHPKFKESNVKLRTTHDPVFAYCKKAIERGSLTFVDEHSSTAISALFTDFDSFLGAEGRRKNLSKNDFSDEFEAYVTQHNNKLKDFLNDTDSEGNPKNKLVENEAIRGVVYEDKPWSV